MRKIFFMLLTGTALAVLANNAMRVEVEDLQPDSVTLRAELPGTFSNRVEFFSCDNFFSNDWKAASGILPDPGTNFVLWIDSPLNGNALRFYRAGDAELDSDGDSITDARELIVHGTAPDRDDTDFDHIDDGLELSTPGLDPLNPDSDGDGLPDGEEVRWGFTDPAIPDNLASDSDGDLLTLGMEFSYGSNPGTNDTDGDGVFDGVEAAQGSDPTDATDNGMAPPSNEVVQVSMDMADNGGSDIYVLKAGKIRTLSGNGPQTFPFQKGAAYTTEVQFAGAELGEPEYAYSASIAEVGGGTNRVFIDDPDGILGTHNGTGGFAAEGKSADVYVPKFEYIIYVDQPVAGNRNVKYINADIIRQTAFVGHTWWQLTVAPPAFVDEFITDPDRARFVNITTGFYPAGYPNNGPGKTGDSPADMYYPETLFNADVTKAFPVEWSNLLNALDRVIELDAAPGTFDLHDWNCSDVSLHIAALCGHILPDTWGAYPIIGGGGTNPADLGEDLREMP